jgi:glucitol operon activator protein
MEEYKELVLLLAGCWFIQIFLSYLQHKNYGKEINELKKRNTGFLGVGISKAKFNLGRGIVLLVVTDEQDCIVTYKEMAGITIFARFKEHQEFIGKKTTETMPLLANKIRKSAF